VVDHSPRLFIPAPGHAVRGAQAAYQRVSPPDECP
jgi:hypothetical protein